MQLDRWGSFSHDRSRFYAAEVVEGIEALYAAGVIHRNLKPEHILIDKDCHIVLCGFGKSEEFQRGRAQSVPSGNPSAGGAPYWMNGSEVLSHHCTQIVHIRRARFAVPQRTSHQRLLWAYHIATRLIGGALAQFYTRC
jgi:serine/threonine protein kinase